MATLTKEERRAREGRVRLLLDAGFTAAEIAERLGVSRQSMWEFIARRGWNGEERAQAIAAREAKRNEARRK